MLQIRLIIGVIASLYVALTGATIHAAMTDVTFSGKSAPAFTLSGYEISNDMSITVQFNQALAEEPVSIKILQASGSEIEILSTDIKNDGIVHLSLAKALEKGATYKIYVTAARSMDGQIFKQDPSDTKSEYYTITIADDLVKTSTPTKIQPTAEEVFKKGASGAVLPTKEVSSKTGTIAPATKPAKASIIPSDKELQPLNSAPSLPKTGTEENMLIAAALLIAAVSTYFLRRRRIS